MKKSNWNKIFEEGYKLEQKIDNLIYNFIKEYIFKNAYIEEQIKWFNGCQNEYAIYDSRTSLYKANMEDIDFYSILKWVIGNEHLDNKKRYILHTKPTEKYCINFEIESLNEEEVLSFIESQINTNDIHRSNYISRFIENFLTEYCEKREHLYNEDYIDSYVTVDDFIKYAEENNYRYVSKYKETNLRFIIDDFEELKFCKKEHGRSFEIKD